MSDDYYRRKDEFYRDQDRRYQDFLDDQRYKRERRRERHAEAFEEIRRGNTMRALGAIDPELAIRYHQLSQSTGRRVSEGDRHPTEPHVAASSTGQWTPEDGYLWSDQSSTSDLSVHWRPGQNSRKHPHLVAADTDGQWTPAPGYRWVDKDANEDMRVRWSPGEPDRTYEHVVASEPEGQWRPAPGYGWVDKDAAGDMRVQWSPGKPHPDKNNMVAGNTEGQWVSASLFPLITPARLIDDPLLPRFSRRLFEPKRKL
jgi:hypothetical protein